MASRRAVVTAAARSAPASPSSSPAAAAAVARVGTAVPISRAGRVVGCLVVAQTRGRLRTCKLPALAAPAASPGRFSAARRCPEGKPARSARSCDVLAMDCGKNLRSLDADKDEEPELTAQMEVRHRSFFAEILQHAVAFLPFAAVASSALALLLPSAFPSFAGRYYALGCFMFTRGISLSANAFLHTTEKLPEREIEYKTDPAEDDDAEILIECRDVYKSFGDKHILSGASFKIREGEAVGIIGPSGTGKSTVLRIMAGLLIPDKGEVYVCGKKRQGLISDEAFSGLRIGLVFQSAALFDSLTVRENVGFMLYEHSDLPEEKIAELVTDSLGAVGLKGVEERLPSELSGGMKKRVALARAIISDDRLEDTERELVMYDEPTAGLDPIASTVVEDLIRSVHIKGQDAEGRPGKISSYVVVTHQYSTIRRAVDRVLFLYDGKIVWQGPPSEFETTLNPIVRQFAEGSRIGPIHY